MLYSTCPPSPDQSPAEANSCPATLPPPSQLTATTHTALSRASYDAAPMLLTMQSTANYIHATYQRAIEIVNLISLNPRLLLASVFAILGIAAEIEQPGFFPRLKELGIALVAIVCASGIIFNAVVLDRLGEGVQLGVDEVWSVVWRWICDVISDEEQIVGEGEEKEADVQTMMFNKGGASVFLLDTPKQYQIGITTHTPLAPVLPQQVSGSVVSRETLTRSRSPLFPLPPVALPQLRNSPPSSHRQEHAYTSRSSTQKSLHHFAARRQADIDTSGLLVEESTHASGLLGLSPMPPHHAVPNEWKNFSGKGFYKYYQKLEAVSKWHNSGSSRGSEDVPREVENIDGKNRGQEEGSAVRIEVRAEQRERYNGDLV